MPQGEPLVIGSEDTQVGDLVGVVGQPGGARLFESGLEDMAVAAFDHPRADRQTQRQGTGIVQAIEPVAQIAMTLSDRGVFVPGPRRFQMFRQGRDDPRRGPTLEAVLLSVSPLLGLVRPAHGCRRGQIFTDMEEVAQKAGLLAEDFPALQLDPFGPVAHRMNPAVQSPAGLPRDRKSVV